ncbi:hypothetical protein FHW69_000115 [Luteibacter sp. Sphag1AF]|uniref:hypothetical protein n=1 Tax=Luteibacter sp. Sphag1AF TaxID=2587031 RepID=UPI00160DDEEC|nr:hypothetical protein [Luteibacter sp. Sphag1AF]MBB3225525.1 hypothetical protein [Luteibacter sp. Sphag1AF]
MLMRRAEILPMCTFISEFFGRVIGRWILFCTICFELAIFSTHAEAGISNREFSAHFVEARVYYTSFDAIYRARGTVERVRRGDPLHTITDAHSLWLIANSLIHLECGRPFDHLDVRLVVDIVVADRTVLSVAGGRKWVNVGGSGCAVTDEFLRSIGMTDR